MYTTYRVSIYDVMQWHYYEEINNEEIIIQFFVVTVAESAKIYHRLSAVCESETWDMGSSLYARKPIVISVVEAHVFTKP